MVRAVFQQIISQLLITVTSKVLIVEVIGNGPFRIAMIPFRKSHIFTIPCADGIHKVNSQRISILVFPCLDVDDIGNVFTVSYSRIVDEVDRLDDLRIQG